MVFCKISQFVLACPGVEQTFLAAEMGGVPGGPSPDQVTEARRAVKELATELLGILDKWCDPSAGPVHALAHEMRGHIMSKLEQINRSPTAPPQWGIKTMKDNAFKVAVDCLGHHEQTYPIARKLGFLWHAQLQFQVEVFMFLCGQLCHRTEGELADRAWHQVEITYTHHPEMFEVAHSRTHMLIGQFVLKAWHRREAALMTRTGQVPKTPFFVNRLRAALPDFNAAMIKLEESSPSEGLGIAGGIDGGGGRADRSSLPHTPAATVTSRAEHCGSNASSGTDFVMVSPDADTSDRIHSASHLPTQVGNGGGGSSAGVMQSDPAVDQFFTGYMDTTALDWDMFADMKDDSGGDAAGSAFPPAIFSGAGLAEWYQG